MEAWHKKRSGRDRTNRYKYRNFIRNAFTGANEARVLLVDGRVAGINAGWLIPNSKRFYGALGFHDYSVPDLGDMLYLEDMVYLKNKGYEETDMGGGEESLTHFKNKFHPQSHYQTHTFSVTKQ